MRHAVFEGVGRLAWREAASPALRGGGEAIVRPIVVGRCDLDVAYLRGVLPMGVGEPIGHEIIAEVVEVGDTVRSTAPGDRVFVPAQISCGTCSRCRRGATGRCERVPFAASYGMGRAGGFGGGLADLVRVPYADAMLTPLPSTTDPAALIGLADMATDAWRGIGPHLSGRPEARVLVIGGMPAVIGLYAVGIAVALGATIVEYSDDDPERRALARLYGATIVDLDSVEPATRDVVFVADARLAALQCAFAAVAPAGTITSATPTLGGPVTLDTAPLYHRGVNWTIGRPDCRGAHDGTMHAWSSCGFDPNLVTKRLVDWDDAPDAWATDAVYVAAARV